MKIEDYIQQAEVFAPVNRQQPVADFTGFYRSHRDEISEVLLNLKEDSEPTREFTLRAGMMAPGSAVIDERIKDFTERENLKMAQDLKGRLGSFSPTDYRYSRC